MERTYELPPSLPADLEAFREQTERFKKGEISATQYRAFRVPQGIYEQRQDGAYMLRVRLPAGRILPHQMRKLAHVACTYGSGKLHVTTRQDIQIHDVSLEDIHPALVELFGA
ncbi:MAG: nitrite reductase, partial [Planctomycetota bacterium]